MLYQRSSQLFVEANEVIPGGVNSPVRAFKGVGGFPIFIKEAKGAYLYDEDGNKYIDYINSWGPMILGHAHEPVVNAIIEKAKKAIIKSVILMIREPRRPLRYPATKPMVVPKSSATPFAKIPTTREVLAP